MLRRGNAYVASGYTAQPRSSPERKILRALRVFRRGGWQSARKGLRSAVSRMERGASAPLRRVVFLFVVAVLISKTQSAVKAKQSTSTQTKHPIAQTPINKEGA